MELRFYGFMPKMCFNFMDINQIHSIELDFFRISGDSINNMCLILNTCYKLKKLNKMRLALYSDDDYDFNMDNFVIWKDMHFDLKLSQGFEKLKTLFPVATITYY